jgi:hypothetical protein
VDHDSVLAENPDPVDVLLRTDVRDDLPNVRRLVLQHREAGALDDHFRQLAGVADGLLQQLLAVVADHHDREQQHGDAQGDNKVKTDLEPEAARDHGWRAPAPVS